MSDKLTFMVTQNNAIFWLSLDEANTEQKMTMKYEEIFNEVKVAESFAEIFAVLMMPEKGEFTEKRMHLRCYT